MKNKVEYLTIMLTEKDIVISQKSGEIKKIQDLNHKIQGEILNKMDQYGKLGKKFSKSAMLTTWKLYFDSGTSLLNVLFTNY